MSSCCIKFGVHVSSEFNYVWNRCLGKFLQIWSNIIDDFDLTKLTHSYHIEETARASSSIHLVLILKIKLLFIKNGNWYEMNPRDIALVSSNYRNLRVHSPQAFTHLNKYSKKTMRFKWIRCPFLWSIVDVPISNWFWNTFVKVDDHRSAIEKLWFPYGRRGCPHQRTININYAGMECVRHCKPKYRIDTWAIIIFHRNQEIKKPLIFFYLNGTPHRPAWSNTSSSNRNSKGVAHYEFKMM